MKWKHLLGGGGGVFHSQDNCLFHDFVVIIPVFFVYIYLLWGRYSQYTILPEPYLN